jgi:predicted MFS family arabinose efflux permease
MNPTIFLLSLAAACTGLGMRAIEPMLPVFAHEFSVSVPVASQLIIVFALFYTFGQFIHGPLGDRYGKVSMVAANVLLTGACMLGSAFATDLASLTLWRAATGVFSCAPFVLGLAYIGDTVPIERRAAVIGHYVIGNVLGHGLGPIVSGTVTDFFGWRATFVVLSVLFGAVGIAMVAVTRHAWKDERRLDASLNPVRVYLEVLKLAPARVLAGISVAEAFLFFGAFAFTGALLKERFDLSYTAIGLILSGFGLGGLLFNLGIRWIVRMVKPPQLVLWGGFVCGGSVLGIGLLQAWELAFPLVFGIGIGFYMLHNVLQTRATEASPGARGVGVSLFGIAWTAGQGLGAAVMGAGIAAVGFAPMMAAFGAGLIALGIWMRFNFHRMP